MPVPVCVCVCVLVWGVIPSERSRATAEELLTFMCFTSEIQAAVLTCSHLREKQPSAWNSQREKFAQSHLWAQKSWSPQRVKATSVSQPERFPENNLTQHPSFLSVRKEQRCCKCRGCLLRWLDQGSLCSAEGSGRGCSGHLITLGHLGLKEQGSRGFWLAGPPSGTPPQELPQISSWGSLVLVLP